MDIAPGPKLAPPVLLEPARVVEHLEDHIVLELLTGARIRLRYWAVPAWVENGDVVTLAVEGRFESGAFPGFKRYGPPRVVPAGAWVVDSPAREVVMTRDGYEAA